MSGRRAGSKRTRRPVSGRFLLGATDDPAERAGLLRLASCQFGVACRLARLRYHSESRKSDGSLAAKRQNERRSSARGPEPALAPEVGLCQVDDLIASAADHGFHHVEGEALRHLDRDGGRHGEFRPVHHRIDQNGAIMGQCGGDRLFHLPRADLFRQIGGSRASGRRLPKST
jgi:hypothetical protein